MSPSQIIALAQTLQTLWECEYEPSFNRLRYNIWSQSRRVELISFAPLGSFEFTPSTLSVEDDLARTGMSLSNTEINGRRAPIEIQVRFRGLATTP